MADPKIRYDIIANAQGEADVERLASELERLDGSLDPQLKARADATAQSLRQLGQQDRALRALLEAMVDANEASRSLESAQQAAARLQRRIDAMGQPTRALAGQQQKLADAVQRAEQAYLASTERLNRARSEAERLGVSTDDLASSQQRLAQLQQRVAAQGRQIAQTYQEQARTAAASADVQARSHQRIRDGVRSISEQLQSLQQVAAAALGGQLVGGLARDLAQTADAYTNLSARIKLVTGDGDALKAALQGVYEVATRTGSSLEATGELFVRIAQAGKQLGLSQQDALALTETINQAVQLSGASAEASQAAITQLIQGLQSGVLRGEEFNSVMEQAPRLARALADALGVTTGQLRAQAEAGALTSEVVIRALQGQAQAVRGEFEQLPLTIGRAVQNLSSAWTVYVSEVDKAGGVSQRVAQVIDYVAKHLDDLAQALYSVGKAAVAYQALRLAQSFLDIGAAARTATAQVVAMTAATQSAAAASATAAAGVGRFASILSGLKAFSLVGIVTNLQEIGTWIGESIAKWQGYGKAIEEAERAQRASEEAARRQAQELAAVRQQMQQASEKALGLTATSKALVGEFNEVVAKGGSAREALDKLAKSMKLDGIQGITDAVTALDVLAQQSKITGDQVRQALTDALKGVDLGAFEAQARAAFDGSEQGVRRLHAALDALSEEALRRAGTSTQELVTGFSAAANSALNDVDALAKRLAELGVAGELSGRLLGKSLDKALEAASTEQAVKAVIDRYQELGRQGLLTGEQLSKGLEKAKGKLDEMREGVSSLDEALQVFGLKSQQEIQRTADTFRQAWQQIRNESTVTLKQKQDAFRRYAEAAIQANRGVVDSTLQTEAAMLGLRLEVDATGQVIVRAMTDASAATDQAGQAAQRAAGGYSDMASAARAAADAVESIPSGDDWQPSVNNAPPEEMFKRAGDMSGYYNLIAKQRAGTLSVDDLDQARAVVEAFKTNLQLMEWNASRGLGNVKGLQSYRNQVGQVQQILQQLEMRSSAGEQPAPTRKVDVRLSMNGRSYGSVQTDDAGASALEQMLRDLEQAARASGYH
ncbi:MAG: tape measure protein [Caldimonas sp.]|uniref:tape measure protein n=1 Tax=Caldimonas sp. TaxID=2838790 RepID=UPI00391C04FF